MEILDLVPSWLVAAPFNFVLAVLMILYVVAVLKDSVRESRDNAVQSEVGIISGQETSCVNLAASIPKAERFEHFDDVAEALETAMRRKMILLFIMDEELSGKLDEVYEHLQSAFDRRRPEYDYSGLRYAIFGVGDTKNDDFHGYAFEFDLRLRKLGATRVVPMRLYDRNTCPKSVEEEFRNFVDLFAPKVERDCNKSDYTDCEECSTSDSESQPDTEAEDEVQIREIEVVDMEIEAEEPAETETKEAARLWHAN